MKVELKERTPECQAAYLAGYQSACNTLRGQMMDKMEHYRSLLRLVINGSVPAKDVGLMIREELRLNPEWEVLEHMPHGELLHKPGWNDEINVGPEPK